MLRVGDPFRSDQTYKTRPGIYAIVVQGADVLLTHQAEPVPEFQLPGGGIDPGEHPLQALYREVLEETGWRVTRPRHVGQFRRYTFMPEYDLWAEKICRVVLAQATTCAGAPSESGHSAFWVSPETAIEFVENDGDRHFLRRVFA